MISIKKLTSTALATIMLAGGIAIAPIITDSAAPEAQAASCATLYVANGGWSRANTCSATQYMEKANGIWNKAAKQKKGVKSQFNVCYYKYQSSGMNVYN